MSREQSLAHSVSADMRSRRCRIVLSTLLLALAVLGGCTGVSDSSAGPGDPSTWSRPPHWDLSTPESAIGSYLDWVSFSYKMANPDLSAPTMTPAEEVRVDAYIELNRLQDRAIEQELMTFTVRSASAEASAAVVSAAETWTYRYFALSTLQYTGGELMASYETTYTLVLQDGAWLIDAVEVTPLGDVE